MPYARLQQVVGQRNEAKEQIAALQAQIAQREQQQAAYQQQLAEMAAWRQQVESAFGGQQPQPEEPVYVDPLEEEVNALKEQSGRFQAYLAQQHQQHLEQRVKSACAQDPFAYEFDVYATLEVNPRLAIEDAVKLSAKRHRERYERASAPPPMPHPGVPGSAAGLVSDQPPPKSFREGSKRLAERLRLMNQQR